MSYSGIRLFCTILDGIIMFFSNENIAIHSNFIKIDQKALNVGNNGYLINIMDILVLKWFS